MRICRRPLLVFGREIKGIIGLFTGPSRKNYAKLKKEGAWVSETCPVSTKH